jgi:hypothetical protein
MTEMIWTISIKSERKYLQKLNYSEFEPEDLEASIILTIDGKEYEDYLCPSLKEELKKWKTNLTVIPIFDYFDGMMLAMKDLAPNSKGSVEWDLVSVPFGFRLERNGEMFCLSFLRYPDYRTGETSVQPLAKIERCSFFKSIETAINGLILEIQSINKKIELKWFIKLKDNFLEIEDLYGNPK